MSNEEVYMEISYSRRYVTGQYQHKEYSIKISGTESQIKQQIEEKQLAVAGLVAGVESVVSLANKATNAGKKVSEILEVSDNGEKSAEKTAPKKSKSEDEADIF